MALGVHTPLIRNISDTARWVAVYRARENERPDGLFRDPYARRLAGERGEEIAAAVEKLSPESWPLPVRTYLFDSYITECVREGVDVVINLAAGLDARPYRMDLPSNLVWVEVDLPEIVSYKESILVDERPRCALRRIRLDLGDRGARQQLFRELGLQAKNALVITEGLVIYLTPEQVGELADDLAAAHGFKHWIVDMVSPGLRRMMSRQFGSLLAEGGVPFKFSPEAGPDFFLPHGWRPIAVRSMIKTAAQKKRINFFMRLLAMLPDPKGGLGNRPWGASILLARP
jgi:methyltransferase (TIGR00027 family)